MLHETGFEERANRLHDGRTEAQVVAEIALDFIALSESAEWRSQWEEDQLWETDGDSIEDAEKMRR